VYLPPERDGVGHASSSVPLADGRIHKRQCVHHPGSLADLTYYVSDAVCYTALWAGSGLACIKLVHREQLALTNP
jgi:hypothetical protein